MRIERWDLADEKTARACYEVMLAAHKADEPVEPPISYGVFTLHLREGWDKIPGEVWTAVDDTGDTGDDTGAVAGFYRIALPDRENRDRAYGAPVVHPASRRRGTGRRLLRHAAGRAAADDRAFISGTALAGGAGDAFAAAVGARLDLEEVRRIQYLNEIAPGTIGSLRATAERAAAGYTLVTWSGVIPEKYHAGMAGILNAFNDAPHGENEEAEFWDAERVRERTGSLTRAGLMRGYGVAALADETGEMAAYTGILVDPQSPQWAFQQLTAVTRAHRGHRLGLLVKTAMLDLLASAEPRVEWIMTGNAAVNQHMIAVNEQLGYRVVEPGWHHYELAVADIR